MTSGGLFRPPSIWVDQRTRVACDQTSRDDEIAAKEYSPPTRAIVSGNANPAPLDTA
ncbi:MAG TPA: hypothetical protein PKX56_02265 [Marmoricola sp.]|nr:hypothetical protein [Marmoricola sp.]HNI71005.1 hypothetical protein [Marmoricola sp.]HNJ78153.1 hypothetical protein [Marmoricola sp.]